MRFRNDPGPTAVVADGFAAQRPSFHGISKNRTCALRQYPQTSDHLGRNNPMSVVETLELGSIQTALHKSCQPELRRLTVVESDDRVEIGGRVSSYYLKSVAIETIKAASDGRPILLNIEVDG
jgi:hypothetical protein